VLVFKLQTESSEKKGTMTDILQYQVMDYAQKFHDRGSSACLSQTGIAPIKDDPKDSGRRLYVQGHYEDYVDEDGQKKSKPVLGDVELHPYRVTRLVHGIAVQAAPGHETQIRPRSSSMVKNNVHVAFGTVDLGYIGELASVVVWQPELEASYPGEALRQKADNARLWEKSYADVFVDLATIFDQVGPFAKLPAKPLLIPFGSRLTQLVHTAVVLDDQLQELFQLAPTSRGAAGFGSTGR
jgi:dUTPase